MTRRGWGNVAFIVLMLALTALFAGLGAWQVERLGEKERLIATVAQGLTSAPVALPTGSDLAAVSSQSLDFRPVTFSGTWLPAGTVLVFTSLGEARGQYFGPGYWVMTPLALEGGGSIFVNRGFVPQASGPALAAAPLPAGPQNLTGVARASEASGGFTPEADTVNRIDWVRNIDRLSLFAPDLPGPVAPFYVDLPAGDPGALPQGGETVVEFPNNHLGYAMTWFGFALITPILLAFWLVRQRRSPPPAP